MLGSWTLIMFIPSVVSTLFFFFFFPAQCFGFSGNFVWTQVTSFLQAGRFILVLGKLGSTTPNSSMSRLSSSKTPPRDLPSTFKNCSYENFFCPAHHYPKRNTIRKNAK
uniref:Uncharacterized protein n=1 Tax=Cacopsylla melanoneura TaxID=428564 RepID=A0A8D8S052_9HEMI